jgi:hypothetical protein
MDKVKITQEQADLIKELLVDEWDKDTIIECAVKRSFGIKKFEPLSNMQTTVLASALINSFEVEETPEDKVIKRFVHWKKMRCVGEDSKTFELLIEGAETILNDLNIKIAGVNHD